jgi:excisionase family DNA binding protein
MTVKDVSAWLQVKPATVYVWAAERKMPALKIHGILRFQREKIEPWLEGCQLEPPSPSHPVNRRPQSDDVDTLTARAKAEVYDSSHGKPEQDRATRKGEHRGTV